MALLARIEQLFWRRDFHRFKRFIIIICFPWFPIWILHAFLFLLLPWNASCYTKWLWWVPCCMSIDMRKFKWNNLLFLWYSSLVYMFWYPLYCLNRASRASYERIYIFFISLGLNNFHFRFTIEIIGRDIISWFWFYMPILYFHKYFFIYDSRSSQSMGGTILYNISRPIELSSWPKVLQYSQVIFIFS